MRLAEILTPITDLFAGEDFTVSGRDDARAPRHP